MTPEQRDDHDLILTTLVRDPSAQRFLIRFQGSNGNVTCDGLRPSNLRALAEAGHGTYLTDEKTYEALVGYDIANDSKHYVIYRLPR